MKKRIFALALALCMMLSVMPTASANGILTLGDGTGTDSNGVLTLDNGTSGSTTPAPTTQPRQNGVLYNTSGSGTEGSTTPAVDPVDDPVIIDTTTYSGENTDNKYTGKGDSGAPTSRKDVDGLFTSKTVSKKNDSTYTVHLEAYTDGTSGTYTSAVPADIVLVLEESSWMSTTMYEYIEADTLDTDETYYIKNGDSYSAIRYCNSTIEFGWLGRCQGWYTGFHLTWFIFDFHWGERINVNSTQVYRRQALTTTKIEALATAATAFVDKVVEDANTNDVDHRVAIVSYSSSAAIDVGLEADIRENNSQVYEAIEDLTAAEAAGSNLALGLEQAQAAFDSAAATTGTRNKVVVVYSYGVAGSGTKTDDDGNLVPSWNTAGVTIANTAINTAKTMKTADKITIYTVGLGDDVDPSLNILDSDVNKEEDIYRTNAYLHFVSSNFPNATNIETAGTNGNINNGKYISALDIASLNSIFEKIENEFETPNISLDANAEIKDTVSKYFNLNTASVKVYTANYSNGTFAARENWDDVTDDDNMTVSKSATAVAVKGFNYNSHFVGGSAPQKLIVEFEITVKSGFMGGNNVPTNNATAGVYVGSALIENFTYPLVNVTIPKPVVDVEGEQVIYYGETAPAVSDLYTKITPTETDAWKYDFVKLTYTVPEGINNDDCATYDFKLNVQPIASATTNVGAAAVAVDSDVAQVKVHVLKAVLDAEDDTIYLGATTNLNELVSHSWACDCEEDQVTRADTSADPDVDYVFSGVASSIEGAYAPADHDCEDITVTCNRGADEDTFTVHVVKPVFETSNDTIYLSNKINLNDLMQVKEDWVCDSECNDKQSLKNADVPNTITIDHSFSENNVTVADELAPEDCATYTVTTTVNGLPAQSDAQVKVHVVKPKITNEDTAIYLGNTVDLNTLVTEEGDNWACDENGEDGVSLPINAEGSRIAPAVDHSFKDTAVINAETQYQPETCTPVTFTTTVTSDVSQDATPEDSDFTVHVHVPQFTVTAQDLWADFDNSVNLFNNTEADAITGHVHTWVDRKDHENNLPVNGDEDVVITDILFSEDDPYTMGETDVDVDVIKVQSTVNGVNYTAVKSDSTEAYDKQLIVTKAVEGEDHDFTIHINKFKAVIANEGEQNAIYTLSNGTKVAVPAKGSVTVAGLICGKEYTISEETDKFWTWRYGTAATANYGEGKTNISCTVGVQAGATDSSVSASMVYGKQSNAKWLSGEDYAINKFDPETQQPAVIPEDRRKKEGADA